MVALSNHAYMRKAAPVIVKCVPCRGFFAAGLFTKEKNTPDYEPTKPTY